MPHDHQNNTKREKMPNLTQLVAGPQNPVGQFCRTTMASKAAARTANKKLSKFDTALPEGERKGYPWMMIGTAFDYRVRLFFEPEFNFEDTVALGRMPRGMASIPGCENTAWFLWNAGVGLTPEQRDDNDYLGRLCIIAAQLEDVWRRSIVGEWFLEAEKMTSEQLLESIPDAWANDITQMIKKLEFTFSDRMPERTISNPVLGRADLNIGADGDLILDDCLIDIKATINAKVSQAMLHQVVCYTLLDREDRFAIRKTGLYMARQGALIVWPLPELLMLLGANNTDIGVLRTLFEIAAHQL